MAGSTDLHCITKQRASIFRASGFNIHVGTRQCRALFLTLLLPGNVTDEHPHQFTRNGRRRQRTPFTDLGEVVGVQTVDDVGNPTAGTVFHTCGEDRESHDRIRIQQVSLLFGRCQGRFEYFFNTNRAIAYPIISPDMSAGDRKHP